MTEPIPVAWLPRPISLEPVGVAARGEAARALAARLLSRPDEELASLRGVAGPDVLIALGSGANLPWADGVVYLGRDPDSPLLLLPTTHGPSVPPQLLERALVARTDRSDPISPPLAVLLDPPLLVSTVEARPIARASLEAWLRVGMDV
jgi:hypothetical protein